MKKLFFSLALLLASVLAFSQGHLENVIVDKVTDAALPGQTAYRVFVDLAPGWEMSGVYGETGNPLSIHTTTTFYNFEGGVFAGRSATTTMFNSAAGRLDSYVTIASFTSSRIGVRVSEDPDGTDGYTALDPNDAMAYTPGMDMLLENVFGPEATGTHTLETSDGAFVDQTGYKTNSFGNRILIGQFTTDGDLTFQLNVQIRDAVGGAVEKYTATPSSPLELNEFQYAKLTYTSVVIPPVVSWVSPAPGAYNTGDLLNLSVNATDAAPGFVSSVVFYMNSVAPANVIAGTVVKSGDAWTLSNWSAVEGTTKLYAVATDNDGNPTSAQLSVVVTTPSNPAPTVSVTAPAGQTLNMNQLFVLRATASDEAPGMVNSVVFKNGASVIPGTVTHAGNVWSLDWTPTAAGNYSITATATDNGGASTISDAVNGYVQDPTAGFAIETDSANCSVGEVFCMPIRVTSALSNVIGFDIPLNYNRSKVHPTGVVYVKSGAGAMIADYNWVSTYINIVDADSIINISLAINGDAPLSTVFSGSGELICVEFVKTAGFGSVNKADFSVSAPGIYVSYANGVEPKLVTAGTYSTYKVEDFNGSILFWKDNSPIQYVSGTNLITNIFGSGNCVNRLVPAVQPDNAGKFVFNTALAKNIKIVRDIDSATDVQSVINGADAQLVARVVINDISYKPTIFQMLAMDVNRDKMVSAGDLTQIMQRAVASYHEFKQKDNYDAAGNKIAGKGVSKDWVFLPSDTIYAEQFRISTAWPFAEAAPGKGYSRFGLPEADTCHKVKIIGSDCPIVLDRTYLGIMLGDVNGSYAGLSSSTTLKSTANNAVVFDVANANIADGFAEVPVYFTSEEQVNSLDFALQFNEATLSLNSIVKLADYLETADHFSSSDRTLRFTSYSMKNIEAGKNLVSLRFATNSPVLKSTDLSSVFAYVNGNPAKVLLTESKVLSSEASVIVYPNPANTMLNVEVSANAKVVLMDMSGRNIVFESYAIANQPKEISVSGMADGIYMLKVYNNEFVKVQKVVVKK